MRKQISLATVLLTATAIPVKICGWLQCHHQQRPDDARTDYIVCAHNDLRLDYPSNAAMLL